jgi:hypothetical protein
MLLQCRLYSLRLVSLVLVHTVLYVNTVLQQNISVPHLAFYCYDVSYNIRFWSLARSILKLLFTEPISSFEGLSEISPNTR